MRAAGRTAKAHRLLLDDKLGGSVFAYLGGVEEVVHNVQEPQPAGVDESQKLRLAPKFAPMHKA
eukprot:4115539-Pyramimonas_sp.AAC.1